MFYVYILLLISTYVCADPTVEDTVFTDQERADARTFIHTTLEGLKVEMEEKIGEALRSHDTQLYFRRCSSYNALRDPAYNRELMVWDEHDERQARMTFYNILINPFWHVYLQNPISVVRWADVYEYMRQENYQSLAYRLKHDFSHGRPKDAKHIQQLDTIMYLTTFLLNKQFNLIKSMQGHSFATINKERREVQAWQKKRLPAPAKRQRALSNRGSSSMHASVPETSNPGFLSAVKGALASIMLLSA